MLEQRPRVHDTEFLLSKIVADCFPCPGLASIFDLRGGLCSGEEGRERERGKALESRVKSAAGAGCLSHAARAGSP